MSVLFEDVGETFDDVVRLVETDVVFKIVRPAIQPSTPYDIGTSGAKTSQMYPPGSVRPMEPKWKPPQPGV